MSEAYRIKKFHHVTVAKHDRLRDEKLVPLLDKLADKHIMNDDFDDLLSSTEAMSLHIEDFDPPLNPLVGLFRKPTSNFHLQSSPNSSVDYLAYEDHT